MQGLVIAGTHSGCGKTTVTIGLLAALKKKGLIVQSFKAGPDFIDTGIHKMITGRPSRNLDLWMCGEDYVKDCFYRNSADADISVVEGVMGMYDGNPSTAHLAVVLDLPVILVVDAYGMAETAGAIIEGMMKYGIMRENGRWTVRNNRYDNTEKSLPSFAGVIFNHVASENHFKRLKNTVQKVPVFGYLPSDLDFEIPHRHLGLTVAEENPIIEKNINKLADTVLQYTDVEKIMEYGRRKIENNRYNTSEKNLLSSIRIAVARDKAFCFYYEDNLDMLKKAGAEIVRFSPMSDKAIPEGIDAIYIGGGYPEIYAEELSKNIPMLKSIKNWAESGRPIYAECGGLMYLSKGIWKTENSKHQIWEMADILPFETEMKEKRSRLGYREVVLTKDCILGKKGETIRGHEFHYSTPLHFTLLSGESKRGMVFSLFDNTGKYLYDEGYTYKNTLASYVHIHFGSNSNIADNFINFIKEHNWKT